MGLHYTKNPNSSTIIERRPLTPINGDVISFIDLLPAIPFPARPPLIPESALLCPPATARPSPRARRSGRQTPTRSATRVYVDFQRGAPAPEYESGSTRFYPNQTAPCPSPSRTARPAMKSPAPPAVRIGDIAGGWPTQGYAVFPARACSRKRLPSLPLGTVTFNIDPSQIPRTKRDVSAGPSANATSCSASGGWSEQKRFRLKSSFGNNLLRPDLFGNGRTGVNPSDDNRFGNPAVSINQVQEGGSEGGNHERRAICRLENDRRPDCLQALRRESAGRQGTARQGAERQ